jgi:hypothetical protein
MDAPEEPQTPFSAVTTQTTKLQRVRCDKEGPVVSHTCPLSLTYLPTPQQYQALLDQSTPFVLYRWVGTGVGLFVFFLRVFFAQGWYIGQSSARPSLA